MAQQVAYLEAIIGADVTSFRRGMQQVRRDLGILSDQTRGLSSLGRALTLSVTTPILAAATASTHMAGEFDAAMRNVNSIAFLTEDQFSSLSAEVLRFGGSIRSGPVAAADALYTVFSSGVTQTEQAMTIMRIASQTAEAGLADMTTTTEALTSALLSYYDVSEITAENTQHFSDVITRTVQVGVGEMNNFVTAFSKVVPTARILGISFDDVGGSLAFLTQRGISAEEAATALNGALKKILVPTDAMAASFEALGVASGTELIDNFGGLQGALNALFAQAGYTSSDLDSMIAALDESPELFDQMAASATGNARALFEMFNEVRAFKAAATIANNLDSFNSSMDDFRSAVDGATDAAHQQQMMAFNAQLDLLKSALSQLAITIGNVILPILTPFINKATDLFLALANLPEPVLKFGILAAGAAAAAGPLLWLFGSLSAPVLAVAGAFGLLWLAISNLDFGYLELGDLINDINNLKQILTDFVSDAFTVLPTQEEVDTATAPLRNMLQGSEEPYMWTYDIDVKPGESPWVLAQRFHVSVETFMEQAGLDDEHILQPGPLRVELPIPKLSDMPAAYRAGIAYEGWLEGNDLGGAVTEGVQSGVDDSFAKSQFIFDWGKITEAFNTHFSAFKSEIGYIGNALASIITDNILPTLYRAWAFVVDNFIPESFRQGINETFGKIFGGLKIPDTLGNLPEILGRLGKLRLDGIIELGENIWKFITKLTSADWSGLLKIGGYITGFTLALWTFTAGIANAVVKGVGDALPGLGDAIAGFVTAISGLIKGDASQFLSGINKGINGLVSAVSGFVAGSADGIINFIEALTGQDYPSVSEGLGAWAGVFDNLSLALDLLSGIMTEDLNRMSATLSGWINNVATDVMLGIGIFVRGVNTAFLNLRKTVLESLAAIKAPLNNFLESIGSNLRFDLGDNISNELALLDIKINDNEFTNSIATQLASGLTGGNLASTLSSQLQTSDFSGSVWQGIRRALNIEGGFENLDMDMQGLIMQAIAQGASQPTSEEMGNILNPLFMAFDLNNMEPPQELIDAMAQMSTLAQQEAAAQQTEQPLADSLQGAFSTDSAAYTTMVGFFTDQQTNMEGFANTVTNQSGNAATALTNLGNDATAGLNPLLLMLREIASIVRFLGGVLGGNLSGVQPSYGAGFPAAAGGMPSVTPGQPIWTGGRGMEAFVPGENGTIIPTRQIRNMLRGGGGGTTQVGQVIIQTNDPDQLIFELRRRGINLA